MVVTMPVPFPGETKAAFEMRTGQSAAGVRVPINAPATLNLGPTPAVALARTPTQVPANGGGSMLPAVIPPALAALIPAGLATGLAAAYGVSQAVGVQYPWETGPGEGFIAPWSRDIVQDESGRWVTRGTRPELFNGAATDTVALTQRAQGVAGPAVVKTWTANGWPFAMTSDGKIHTVNKSGVRKSWRPYRSIVLGKKMNQGMALRAVRKLEGIKNLAYRIEDLAGRGMKHTVKRSKKKS